MTREDTFDRPSSDVRELTEIKIYCFFFFYFLPLILVSCQLIVESLNDNDNEWNLTLSRHGQARNSDLEL